MKLYASGSLENTNLKHSITRKELLKNIRWWKFHQVARGARGRKRAVDTAAVQLQMPWPLWLFHPPFYPCALFHSLLQSFTLALPFTLVPIHSCTLSPSFTLFHSCTPLYSLLHSFTIFLLWSFTLLHSCTPHSYILSPLSPPFTLTASFIRSCTPFHSCALSPSFSLALLHTCALSPSFTHVLPFTPAPSFTLVPPFIFPLSFTTCPLSLFTLFYSRNIVAPFTPFQFCTLFHQYFRVPTISECKQFKQVWLHH